jgi:amino acid transporter
VIRVSPINRIVEILLLFFTLSKGSRGIKKGVKIMHWGWLFLIVALAIIIGIVYFSIKKEKRGGK